VSARNARATCLIDLGQPDAALAIYRDCIERCIGHGLSHHERLCWLNTGLAHIEMERWEVAREATERVRRDGAETTTQILGAAEFNSGLIAEGMDDLPRARRHYADSLAIREGNGQVALRIDSLAGLLRVATNEQRRDEMHQLLAEIETLLGRREIAGVEHPGRLFRTLIESNRQLGHADRADAWLAKATAFLDRRAACIEHPANRATYRTVPAANRWIAHEAGHPGDTLESPETQ
jgi:tetratricopeptide (TPR) repeat protein